MSRIFLSFLTISVILLITLNSFAGTEPKVISLDVQIQAHPEFEQMLITTIVSLEQIVPGTYQAVFTQPTPHLWTIENFKNVFENTSGRDLTSFFDKWYFQRGI